MSVWRRTGWSAKAVGAAALGGALALLTVPVAMAVEDTTTQIIESEPLEPVREPTPTDSSGTEPAEEDTGVVGDTLDTVDETDDTGTLEPVTDTAREVLLPSEEEPAPSQPAADDSTSGEDAGEDADGASTTEGETAPAQDQAPADEPEAEQAPPGPLPAEPASPAGTRRPFTPASVDALSGLFGGSSGAGSFGDPSGLMDKLIAMDDLWGGSADPQLSLFDSPSFLFAPSHAADVAVPLGPRSTLDIIEKMGAAGSFSGSLARTLAPFPVAGPATYSDDFGAPRHTPSLHDHEGTDIFAPRGTPVIASAPGTIRGLAVDTTIGGNSLKLFTADGSYFYYAHLAGFAPGIAEGSTVELGQVLGFVGDTGNALGTPAHLHYEIHPAGGGAVNPVRFLDRWLANARGAADSLAGASQGVWTPQVAAPAGSGQAAADGTSTSQGSPDVAALGQPDPSLTGSLSRETSPLSVFFIVAAILVLFAMLRRPRAASKSPTGHPDRSVHAAPAASPVQPAAAPFLLLTLPGDAPARDEDEFEWMTIGA